MRAFLRSVLFVAACFMASVGAMATEASGNAFFEKLIADVKGAAADNSFAASSTMMYGYAVSSSGFNYSSMRYTSAVARSNMQTLAATAGMTLLSSNGNSDIFLFPVSVSAGTQTVSMNFYVLVWYQNDSTSQVLIVNTDIVR